MDASRKPGQSKLTLNLETLQRLDDRTADMVAGAAGWTMDFGGPGICSNRLCALSN